MFCLSCNWLLFTAALLLIGVAAAHSYLGEKYILIRLFRRELPKLYGDDAYTKQALRFAWHLTSVAWLGFAAIVLSSPSPEVLRGTAITFAVSAIFPLYFTRGKHLAWIPFLMIATLCWLASN